MIQEISAVIPASSNEQDGKLELVVKPPEGEFEPETMSRLRKKYEHYPIQVLATDYSNWGLVWMCKEQESANARTGKHEITLSFIKDVIVESTLWIIKKNVVDSRTSVGIVTQTYAYGGSVHGCPGG